MIGPLKKVNPKTKILFFAIVFILIPGAILSYLGLRSIDKNAENLRTKYVGTINLVRDKLEREVISREKNLLNSLIDLIPQKQNEYELKLWLRDIESKNPAIKYPFLIYADGGFVSTNVSFSKTKTPVSKSVSALEKKTGFRTAEEEEFIKKDYIGAIKYYRELQNSVSTLREKALLLSRIGRCYYKAGEIKKGIGEYSKILNKEYKDITLGEIPSTVISLSQIADGYKVLNNSEEQYKTNLELYQQLMDNPWDLNGGEYIYYLKSAGTRIRSLLDSNNVIKSPESNIEELFARENEMLKQIRFIELGLQKISLELTTETNPGISSELQPQHATLKENNSILQLGYFKLPPTFLQSRLLALCYRIEKDYILSNLLPEVLTSVELGRDVLIGVLDGQENLLYLQDNLQLSNYLVAEKFLQPFVTWKVAMFDRSGNTIEELTGKEKRLYYVLFAGIIIIMITGVIFTVRAVIHESEASRIKSEFVSNVSHEFKTPLSLIRMFGETLETGIVTDEAKRKEFYSIIRKESERLTHLINNVLDFSKMDSGIKEYNFVESDLVKIIRSSLEAYKFHIRDLGFDIENRLPSELIMPKIDEDAISQAFLNLLSNAVKYSKERKNILVQVHRDSNSALISVKDHGVGISKKEIKKIFDKFYRVPGTEVTGAGGSGLGLTLAKHIIKAHGGTIDVESEVGGGSTFTIKIPV
jgi:signal transduction histidine kinase